jgi:hypothetical protein
MDAFLGFLMVLVGLFLLAPLGFVIILAFIMIFAGIWETFWKPILNGYWPWDYPPKGTKND